MVDEAAASDGDDEAELLSPLYLPPPPPPSHRSVSSAASLRHFSPIEFPARLAKEIGLPTGNAYAASKTKLPPAAVVETWDRGSTCGPS